jgi:hypothetical protein
VKATTRFTQVKQQQQERYLLGRGIASFSAALQVDSPLQRLRIKPNTEGPNPTEWYPTSTKEFKIYNSSISTDHLYPVTFSCEPNPGKGRRKCPSPSTLELNHTATYGHDRYFGIHREGDSRFKKWFAAFQICCGSLLLGYKTGELGIEQGLNRG